MTEREQFQQAIDALEAQRAILGDAVVNIALAPLREKLAALEARATPDEQQRKQVTVLFADISGFTAMTETMDAEEVSGLVNELWTLLDAAITRHGGHIDKHIGDAVMALFGAPVAREDDPERAVRAALDMQAALGHFVREQLKASSHGPQSIKMRVGINTGPVLLGTIGTTGEYTAMGDAVNLASRLEHAAPIGGILISLDTYRHVRGVFDVTACEPLAVRGKTEPVQTYVVLAARPRGFLTTTRGIEGITTPTVGRDGELRQLQAAFNTARDECLTHAVTVVAEAGVGKSRLLTVFTEWLEALPERTSVFTARATPDMSHMPYALARNLLAMRFDIQDSDPAALARDKLERGILGLMGAAHEEQAHFIGHLCGFDFSNSPHLAGILSDARQIRDLGFHYFGEFFAAVSRETPAALVLEDIHWADEGSLDLFDDLVRSQPALPLMLLCASRPSLLEARPQWGAGALANTRIELRPLSEDHSRELLREILCKVPHIPEGLQQLIVGRAEGSPYYLEELVKTLIEEGVIVAGDEQWSVVTERLNAIRVPATLTGILQARLDGLPPPERETLQQASVVGRVFWGIVLERLRTGAAAAEARVAPGSLVADYLGALARKDLILRHDTTAFASTDEFTFKQGLLQEVTYESVLKRLRREYHAQVAASLIELSGERANEHAARIGQHYEQAGDPARAASWYGRAAKQAQDTYALEPAEEYYRKALHLWSTLGDDRLRPERLQTLEGLGAILVIKAHYGEAIQTFESMRTEAESHGERLAQSRACYGLARAHSSAGDHRAAFDDAAHAESVARAIDAPVELAMALEMKGRCLFRLGDPEAALALGERLLPLARATGVQIHVARGLNLLGVIHNSIGHHAQAEQCFTEALAICQAIGDRSQAMSVMNNLGLIAEARGNYPDALRYYQDALRSARAIGHRDRELVFFSNIAGVQVQLGDYAAAESNAREVIGAAGQSEPDGLALTYGYLAEACLGQRKTDEARRAALRALALSQKRGVPLYLASAWRVLGLVAAQLPGQGLVDETGAVQTPYDARGCFAESMRICTAAHLEDERARTLRAWAEFERQCGNAEYGSALLQDARDIFERIGADGELARLAQAAAAATGTPPGEPGPAQRAGASPEPR